MIYRLPSRPFLGSVAALAAVIGIGVYALQTRMPKEEPVKLEVPSAKMKEAKTSLSPLHPVVHRIVKEGPSMPYLKFNYLIKELPTTLPTHDIEALLDFIMDPPLPGAFREGEWASLTNDIQEALSVQVVPDEKVADAFIATYRDESRSQIMRDYALQHIGGFAIYLVHTAATRTSAENTEPGLPGFFPKLVDELTAAAQDVAQPWCGTALNLLDGLLRAAQYRGMEIHRVSPEILVTLALPVASNPASPLNARLPALQLASRHKAPQALELARTILRDPESSVMLVQSASAVVGELGTSQDIPLLQTIVVTGDIHRLQAAQEAIQRIQNS